MRGEPIEPRPPSGPNPRLRMHEAGNPGEITLVCRKGGKWVQVGKLPPPRAVTMTKALLCEHYERHGDFRVEHRHHAPRCKYDWLQPEARRTALVRERERRRVARAKATTLAELYGLGAPERPSPP